ncbi:DNA polymerase III subunit gamma/tau [Marinobacter zhanjiangensis]|uniref:DNA polymerase III subunit gamma/tau n=1 Tax=Marinobacter zhanjiangensis TaxID=578215 RepID=A0ABQ3BB92_9GAMM|nr:DNA polymerase III subunit gamma/tau [Marinobacter zhanjiangensis]GGY82600.1 DNA polymerase III subunit gamma/tau [Marinobacter zhanjiangensis]
MSYQVLARKWRPHTFSDMVGQEHVLQALIHALEHNRLHHAYLFTGTRGVGKTTIGRLLARCLNCEKGITPDPCGECSSCQEILDGRFVDLIEIDAASRTGVDDMRELTDNVQYAPSRGRFKVYLIDEVHMLTNQSFNAFLKTLEEPPEHVKFLLATTDPQKLPVTVLSRCLQFNLKRMTPEHIVSHLRYILGEETVPFEEPALWQLARAADGSMRDALSLTDQAIAFGNQKLGASDVSSMLGTIDQRDIEKLVDALVDHNGPELLTEIDRISDFAPDFSAILADLLSLFHRITTEQVVPGSADNAMGDAHRVQELARQLSAEDAQLFYQAALVGRKDLEITPDARMGFEMTLLRMLAFRPGAERRDPPANSAGVTDRNRSREGSSSGGSGDRDTGEEPAPAALESLAGQPNQPPSAAEGRAVEPSPQGAPDKDQPGLTGSPEPEPTEIPAGPAATPRAEGTADSGSAAQGGQSTVAETAPEQQPPAPHPEDDSLMAMADQMAGGGGGSDDDPPWDTGPEDQAASAAPQPDPEITAPSAATTTVEAEASPESAEPQPTPPEPESTVDAGGFVWARDFRQLGILGMPGNLASQASCERHGDTFVLTLDEGHYRLLTERHRQKILEGLRAAFGDNVTLEARQGDPGNQTPIAWETRDKARRQQQAEQAIAQDPHVNAIVERFEGRVVKDSIRPLENSAG